MPPHHLSPADFEELQLEILPPHGPIWARFPLNFRPRMTEQRMTNGLYSSDNLISVFHKEKQESRCQLPIFLIQIVGKSTALVWRNNPEHKLASLLFFGAGTTVDKLIISSLPELRQSPALRALRPKSKLRKTVKAGSSNSKSSFAKVCSTPAAKKAPKQPKKVNWKKTSEEAKKGTPARWCCATTTSRDGSSECAANFAAAHWPAEGAGQ